MLIMKYIIIYMKTLFVQFIPELFVSYICIYVTYIFILCLMLVNLLAGKFT